MTPVSLKFRRPSEPAERAEACRRHGYFSGRGKGDPKAAFSVERLASSSEGPSREGHARSRPGAVVVGFMTAVGLLLVRGRGGRSHREAA